MRAASPRSHPERGWLPTGAKSRGGLANTLGTLGRGVGCGTPGTLIFSTEAFIVEAGGGGNADLRRGGSTLAVYNAGLCGVPVVGVQVKEDRQLFLPARRRQ